LCVSSFFPFVFSTQFWQWHGHMPPGTPDTWSISTVVNSMPWAPSSEIFWVVWFSTKGKRIKEIRIY
jgi:hypothetical protein